MTNSPNPDPVRSFVIIGDTNLGRRVCASLHDSAHTVQHLTAPGDKELRATLASAPATVAVLLHDDVAALRYALAVAHLSPLTRIIVTIFDRTVADELLRLLPQCHVTSPADLVAPTLAGPCIDAAIAALQHQRQGIHAVRAIDGDLHVHPWTPPRRRWRSLLGKMAGQLHPHDTGTRIMLAGLLGLLAALLTDWTWWFRTGHRPARALFDAVRVVTAVGPAPPPHSPAYQVVSSAVMLSTLVFSAMFTAGLIDRMLGPKLVRLIGPRTVPRFGHVIVVGIGQVGLRLCGELRRLGIPVVGVERDPYAPNVRLARSLGIPVLVGHGGDRAILEQLHLGQARALAAVGSDDLDNIAVAIAAQAVAPQTRVVLRAGEHEAIAETRSLLPLGTIRDVTSLAAAYVLAHLLERPATGVVAHQDRIFVESPRGGFTAWPLVACQECSHLEARERQGRHEPFRIR